MLWDHQQNVCCVLNIIVGSWVFLKESSSRLSLFCFPTNFLKGYETTTRPINHHNCAIQYVNLCRISLTRVLNYHFGLAIGTKFEVKLFIHGRGIQLGDNSFPSHLGFGRRINLFGLFFLSGKEL